MIFFPLFFLPSSFIHHSLPIIAHHKSMSWVHSQFQCPSSTPPALEGGDHLLLPASQLCRCCLLLRVENASVCMCEGSWQSLDSCVWMVLEERMYVTAPSLHGSASVNRKKSSGTRVSLFYMPPPSPTQFSSCYQAFQTIQTSMTLIIIYPHPGQWNWSY